MKLPRIMSAKVEDRDEVEIGSTLAIYKASKAHVVAIDPGSFHF